MRALLLAVALGLTGCRPDCADCAPVDAGGLDAGPGEDAGTADAGLVDGGVPRDCAALSFDGSRWTRAGYFTPALDAPSTAVTLGPSGTGPWDFLDVELWYFGTSVDPTFPYPVMLWATTRAQCEVCVVLKRGCDASGGGCTSAYLSFGGSIVFDAASRDADAGRLAGSASVLRLLEWDFVNDAEVDGGACLEVPGLSFDAGW